MDQPTSCHCQSKLGAWPSGELCIVAGEVLGRKDGVGIEDVNQLAYKGLEPCDVLLIEVPMQVA